MASRTARLIRAEEVAEGTMAFHFSRPEGFEFLAGQFVDVKLVDPPEHDAEGDTRTFTLASAPFEKLLMVATRMRNTAFKRVLRQARPGMEVDLEGPGGSFTLHRDPAKPAVFLAGGIGITPFLSILRQAAAEGSQRAIYLFYSNRRPEDAAFLEALAQFAKVSAGFRFIPSMTEMERSSREWTGETGFIDRAMLLRALSDLKGPIYYLAGPPAMVTAMRRMLDLAGVDQDDLRTEEFSGY